MKKQLEVRAMPRGPFVALASVALMSLASIALLGASPVSSQTAGGDFDAAIAGSISRHVSGTASSMGMSNAPAGWQVRMQAADGAGAIMFMTDGMGRPSPGTTYPFASTAQHGGNAPVGEFTALVALVGPSVGAEIAYGSVSGSLTITASSPTAVSGRFDFTAQDAADPSRTVTVTGTFTALNQDL